MTEVNQVNTAKSRLAKLLATENITIRQSASAKTASFDIKNRLLTLPIWTGISAHLGDMLIVHEVGHALDTPAEWYETIKTLAQKLVPDNAKRAESSVRSFLNIIEDARIDKRQKRRYPGCRVDYLKGYKELIERDFLGTKKRDVNTFSFIDRINIYYKGGALNFNMKFLPAERAFLKRIDDAETWEQVVQLTEEIFLFCKNEEQQTNTLDLDDFEFGECDDEDGEYELIEDDDIFDDEEEYSSKSQKANDKSEKDLDSDDDSDDDSGNKAKGAGGDDLPEVLTDDAFERMKNSLSGKGQSYVYITAPEIIKEVAVTPFKKVLAGLQRTLTPESVKIATNGLKKFKDEENATISYMVKEFETRKSADIYSRISIAKTGVIDTNKLHSYKYSEDIFRRLAIVPNGKSHGFVVVLDWSGSMSDNLDYTVKQLISLTLFCKRVNIPFEVYTFRSVNRQDEFYGDEYLRYDPKQRDVLHFSEFRMRNILSSKMSLTEYNQALVYLWAFKTKHYQTHLTSELMGSTPLDQAILATEQLVLDFQKKNKVQIVSTIFLTDGDADGGCLLNATQGQHSKYILTDPVTKKEYWMSYCHGRELTSTLLQKLKDRTGCNLIGFFLYGSNFGSAYNRFYSYSYNVDHKKELQRSWDDNGFFSCQSAGYDEYFILKIDDSAYHSKLKIDSSMTKRKIADAFQKFSAKKSVKRVLLNQFITKIASDNT